MEVNLELKPIRWGGCHQGTFTCGNESILAYSVCENSAQNIDAQCYLVDNPELLEKHGLIYDLRNGCGNFESIEEAKGACEAHFRELMLKAFLQPV